MVIGTRTFKTIVEHLTQTAGKLVIASGLLLGILLVSCSIVNPDSFAVVGGDEQLVVLLRNDQDGHYQVRFEGSKPTQLNSLQVMLGGQTLHVDVVQVAVIQDDQEVILEGDGSVPDDSQVIFDPDEEFEVQVTYHGQSLGGNYMYGFRMVYGDNPQAEPVDLITEYEYAVIVE